MSRMLLGNAIAKTDDRGRLKLPASFRAEIEASYGNEFFVTSLRGESVRIYPMEVWLRIQERLAQSPPFNPSVMRFKKRTNYYGQKATMDGQGRILIHPLLRDKAQIDGEVAVLGQQDHLEIWNRANFERGLDEDPLTDDDLASLSDFGI